MRWPRKASVPWRAAAFLPFVVSPVTVAFGLLLLYPGWTASLPLLLAAYAVLAYPFVAKSMAAGLDSLPPHVLQAARTLGASPQRTFWRVTLPLLRPALRRGMAFAAATALGEFAVTLFLSRPEWATLTTLIYQRLGHPGAASLDQAFVLACLLMVLALLAFLLIEWPVAQQDAPHALPGKCCRCGGAAPCLTLRHISQNYGDRPLLQDINLSVAAGEIVALLGPSGSGKSTLLNIVAGLQQPLSGSVWFDGRDITAVPPEQRRFALMFQDFALFPHLDVLDNVAFGLVEQRQGKAHARAQALETAGTVWPGRPRPAQGLAFVGRRAAARGAGPRPDHPAARAVARRAFFCARYRFANQPARRISCPDSGRGHAHAVGHARRTGGPRHGRPRSASGQRAACTGLVNWQGRNLGACVQSQSHAGTVQGFRHKLPKP